VSPRRARLITAVVATLALSAPLAVAHEGEVHPPPAPTAAPRVGVLIADHGEPPEYNADTYESFREFFGHLIEMGVVPQWLRVLDTGTVLMDAECPACEAPSTEPRLVDAWLRAHDGPAVFVPASSSLPAHYVLPTGPGRGEPDIFEHVGLQAWQEWRAMGGRSPNYDEKLAKKTAVIERLTERYGDRLAIRVGYGIDPRIGGGRQGIREALDALVNRDRVTELVVAYHGVGFSDLMQTHHLRHVIEDHLANLGAGELLVRYAAPIGETEAYVQAIAAKVGAELAAVPAGDPVAIHLSGHGLATGMCGDYDCGADAYHASSHALFERAKAAILEHIDRPGRTEIFHIYGDGGDGESDPDDEVTSPLEGLAQRRDAGFRHVIDIPHEFDSNSRDTLIILRQSYGRPTPDWNARWESSWDADGLHVKIANALGGEALKADALERVILDALEASDDATGPSGGHPH
jgi:hypothetical protein